jgi:hypothetical protein
MKKLMLVAAAMCLLAAGVATAQVEETVIYKDTTILDIQEPMQVPGELVRPSSSYLPVKKGADFDLLIPVRDNFLPEMMQTAGVL